jgi:hypothetical protein
VDEPVPRYPKRPVVRSDAAVKELEVRTLINARPQRLVDAHVTTIQCRNGAQRALGACMMPNDLITQVEITRLLASLTA